MIVGLFGVPATLNPRLMPFLSHRGSYSCLPEDLGKLEPDRKFVFESVQRRPKSAIQKGPNISNLALSFPSTQPKTAQVYGHIPK